MEAQTHPNMLMFPQTPFEPSNLLRGILAHCRSQKKGGNGCIRELLDTCKSRVFYDSACLLDYKHHSDDWKSVFADYNAGHYASRKAGFQKILGDVSRKTLDLDGVTCSATKTARARPSSPASPLSIC